jgi:hypothetical protein
MVSSGDRHVQVWIKGSNPEKLRKAEKTAKRLLAETVQPTVEKPKMGFAPKEEG